MVVPSIVVPIPKHAAPGACVYISTTAGEFLFNLPARSAGRSVKVMLPKPSGATKPPRLSCAWLGDEVIAPRRDAGTLRSPLAVLEGYLAERLAEHGVAGNLPVAQARAAPPPKRCCVPGLSRCLWGGRAAAQRGTSPPPMHSQLASTGGTVRRVVVARAVRLNEGFQWAEARQLLQARGAEREAGCEN